MAGAFTGTTRYGAWGNITASTGNTPQYGYTGREPDATGLVYYRSRYYDPQIGRFTQPDPKGFIDGLNRYVYVMNSPVNYVDPWGMSASTPTVTGDSGGIWGSNILAEAETENFFQNSPLAQAYKGNYADTPSSIASYAAKKFIDPYHQSLENPVARFFVGFLTSGSVEDTLGMAAMIRGSVKSVPTSKSARPGSYTPNRILPTDKQGVPIPDSNFPHTQLGRSKPKYGSEPQAREWGYGSNGNLQPKRDIDFTDHGFPDVHPHVPHQHKLTPNNPKLAPKGGYRREKGGGSPL
nr:RHS repeat-associated core domain-containing protein [uncultured Desulfobulbus sp.]